MDEVEDILRRLGIIEEELSYSLGEQQIDKKEEATARLMEEAYASLQESIAKLAKFVELSKLEIKLREIALKELNKRHYSFSPLTHRLEVTERENSWEVYFSLIKAENTRGGECKVLIDKKTLQVQQVLMCK